MTSHHHGCNLDAGTAVPADVPASTAACAATRGRPRPTVALVGLVGLSVLIGSVLVVAVAALVVGRSSRAVRTWEPLWQAAAAAFAGATLGLFFGALVLAIVYA